MRRFTDEGGDEWTAVLGRASYGEMTLLFSRTGSHDVFSAPLETDTAAGGRDYLAELPEDELRARLAGAHPWSDANS